MGNRELESKQPPAERSVTKPVKGYFRLLLAPPDFPDGSRDAYYAGAGSWIKIGEKPLETEALGIDANVIEESFFEVTKAAQTCGGIHQLIEQGGLSGDPAFEQTLSLISEENKKREAELGMPPKRSEAINLGAEIMALVIKTVAQKQAKQ